MIVIVPLNGKPKEYFENYNELFESILSKENLQNRTKLQDVRQRDWSFTIYPSKHVAALYAHSDDFCEAMEEANEENLPLIEICAGDYRKPSYIALTPNIDLDYLKRKWCVDWCTYHHVLVREV